MSMLNRMALPILLAFVPALAGASESPMTTGVSVLFSSGSYQFTPNNDVRMILGNLRSAAMITVNGRTSGASGAEKNEKLALARAIAARNWLVTQGVSPEKVMINFASGVDFIAPNSTPEGQLLNQRVDIEATYVSYSSSAVLAKSPGSRTQYRCPVPPSTPNGSTSPFTYSGTGGTAKPFSFVASSPVASSPTTNTRTATPSHLADEVAKKINAVTETPSVSVQVGRPIEKATPFLIDQKTAPASTASYQQAPDKGKVVEVSSKFSLVVRAGETWEQSLTRWIRDNGYDSVLLYFPEGQPEGFSLHPKNTYFPGIDFDSSINEARSAFEKESGVKYSVTFDKSNKTAVIHPVGVVTQTFNIKPGSLKQNAARMTTAYGWNTSEPDWRIKGDYYISAGWPIVTQKGDIATALNMLVASFPVQPQLLKSTQHVFFVTKDGQ